MHLNNLPRTFLLEPASAGVARSAPHPAHCCLGPPRLQVHAAGQLLTRDFVSMLPFTDELVLLELAGADLLRALETGVGSWPALEGRFLQVGRHAFVRGVRV